MNRQNWTSTGAGAALALLAATPAARAQEPPKPSLDTFAGTVRVETVASGLQYPWDMVFLPDGGMLVSEKHPGRLRRVETDGTVSAPLAGLPEIYAEGNAGLLGLALDPAFAGNRRLYFAYAEPGEGGKAGLAVARATLGQGGLADVEVLFRQTPKVEELRDFGGRLVFAPDGTLFVGTGDLFAQDLVQELGNTIGKVVRITTEGDAPADNPFVGQDGIDPVIWSWGHRNVGGLAVNPETGALWEIEFGPWGGDELNIVEPGRNYGWPLVSWGRHYEGRDIPDPPTRPDLAQSIYHWNPVISPSGMTFYDGDAIPAWKGNLILGGLSSEALTRLTLRGDRVISEERIDFGTRVRDVAQGPDGALYLLTDEPEAEIFRLVMEDPAGAAE